MHTYNDNNDDDENDNDEKSWYRFAFCAWDQREIVGNKVSVLNIVYKAN